MRFTKIPLIATLMAVALSLLIVLPALAENRERTDGRGGNANNMEIGVFDNITDARAGEDDKRPPATGADPKVYVPIDPIDPVKGTPTSAMPQGKGIHTADR